MMVRYLDYMLSLLTSAYNRSPQSNIGKLFGIWADGLEAVRATFLRMQDYRGIDRAEGAALDLLGANYGVAREGATDVFFRMLIKSKMMAQLAGCNTNSILRALSALFAIEPGDITIEDVYPAKVRVYIDMSKLDESMLPYIGQIGDMTKRLLAAGVGLMFEVERILRANIVIEHHAYVQQIPYVRRLGTTARLGVTPFAAPDGGEVQLF